ncbi:MAG TPA: hypothetical protein VFZ31_12855 [Vicinamibacterales bacterium]
MRRLLSVMVVAAMFTAACGKSEEQKQAEQAAEELKKAAENVAKAAEQAGTAAAAQGTNDMAKAMQGFANALSGAGPDGKPVEPVAFQTLQSHLPQVSGWEMEEPEGERMTMPVPFSQVETTYKKGEARIDAKIVDTGFAQMLVAPWSMMLASGYSRESSSGYEKATTISGNPAIEKWDKTSKNGELDVLVGKRFMVTIEGHDIDDMKQLQDFAANFNFGAIASAK